MGIFLQVFYAFFSSIIMALAIQNEFLPFGSPFLGLFALVPLYLAIAGSSSFKRAGLLTALQMFCTHVFSSFWLGYFKDFAIFTLGAPAALYTVFGYYIGGLFFEPFYLTRKTALQEQAGLKTFNSPLRILLFAVLWTLYEWVKSIGFLAYPWGTLVMAAWKWKFLTQIVDITGTRGISFLFALFNALIAEGLFLLPRTSGLSGNKKICPVFYKKIPTYSYTNTALFCILLFTFSSGYGVYQYTKIRTPAKTVRTLLVQPNFDSWLAEEGENALKLSMELTQKQLDAEPQKPDLILWPESILPHTLPTLLHFYSHYPKDNPLIPFIEKNEVPLISGSPVEVTAPDDTQTNPEFNNSAVYFDKTGKWQSFYGKVQLVPFAEVIPYADKKLVQDLMQSIVGFSNGWTSGKYYTVFDIPLKKGSATISTPVCFEDAFPYICRNLFCAGSEAFFNITNDAWSKTDSAELQHFVIASYRAQEFRSTLVRCTNSGFTVVTDPAGRILYSLPLFQSLSGVYEVPIYERTITAYARFGDWLASLLCLVWFGFYAAVFIKKNDKPYLTKNA